MDKNLIEENLKLIEENEKLIEENKAMKIWLDSLLDAYNDLREQKETLMQAYIDDIQDVINRLSETEKKMKGLELYVGKHCR